MSGKRKRKDFRGRKSHEWIKVTLLVFVLVICMVVIACVGALIGMYSVATDKISELNVKNLAYNDTSLIYYIDEDGKEHKCEEEIYGDGKRTWVGSKDISEHMKKAVVAIEDERFYQHNGIDVKRTAGAVLTVIKERSIDGFGGSTITQQLVKNITGNNERTIQRKINEMLQAVALEKELTKDEILTLYLNYIYLANQCTGVEAAANLYYSKSASELTLNESAVLAGITQYPSYYDPIRNPKNAKDKRDTILYKMHELGYISEKERDDTLAKDIELNVNYEMKSAKVYSYFTDNMLNEVVSDLQTKAGYGEDAARQLVYSGGIKIYSTVDPKVQTALEEYYENNDNFSGLVRKEGLQSAMVIVDPYTGQIKGMVGGVGKKTEPSGLNRAVQSKLQPGSAIKPITVYGPALEEDIINATTTVSDEPITIDGWTPKNAYSRVYGNMSVRRAVKISSNTAAVRVLQKVTTGKSYQYATERFGLSLVENDEKPAPLALGGLTNGVSPTEMVAAYSVFANGGKYIKPHSYTKVVDRFGNVLLENNVRSQRVIRESTAFLMTDILYSVVNSNGGTGILAKFSDKMPIYGKTGTTNGTKDKWFVGFTPYYVGAVWCGYDKPQSLDTSKAISAQIWGDVMGKVHEGLPVKEFTPPDTVIKKGSEYFYVDSKLKRETHAFESEGKNKDSAYGEPGSDSMPAKPKKETQKDEKSEESKSNGETKTNEETDTTTESPPGEEKKENTEGESEKVETPKEESGNGEKSEESKKEEIPKEEPKKETVPKEEVPKEPIAPKEPTPKPQPSDGGTTQPVQIPDIETSSGIPID